MVNHRSASSRDRDQARPGIESSPYSAAVLDTAPAHANQAQEIVRLVAQAFPLQAANDPPEPTGPTFPKEWTGSGIPHREDQGSQVPISKTSDGAPSTFQSNPGPAHKRIWRDVLTGARW